MKQMPLFSDRCLRVVFDAAIEEWLFYNPNADAWTRDQAAVAIKQSLGLMPVRPARRT